MKSGALSVQNYRIKNDEHEDTRTTKIGGEMEQSLSVSISMRKGKENKSI